MSDHSCDVNGSQKSSFIVDPVLSFIKALRLKGYNETLRNVIMEHCSSADVEKQRGYCGRLVRGYFLGLDLSCMCLLIVRVQRSSPWQHASIHPGLVSLLFIPSLYSLSKDFSFTGLLSHFLLHTAYYILCSEEYIAWGYLLLFTHLCMYANFQRYNC